MQLSCFVTLCVLSLFLNVACTPHSIYYDKNFNPPVYFGQHVVRKGDTLYSIARRYGRGVQELAGANNIEPPYIISLGQKINLERVITKGKSRAESASSSAGARANVTKSKIREQSVKNANKRKKGKNFNKIKWRWPHLGPIIAKYTSGNKLSGSNVNTRKHVNKGVDISGKVGEPIYAAAAGEVVYAGSGLLGYGNLVIINHNEVYLSAYAHNHQIFVQEGQKIEAGEKIAEMGRSGTNKPMLHFEIRKNGEPVNPMKYLPARRN